MGIHGIFQGEGLGIKSHRTACRRRCFTVCQMTGNACCIHGEVQLVVTKTHITIGINSAVTVQSEVRHIIQLRQGLIIHMQARLAHWRIANQDAVRAQSGTGTISQSNIASKTDILATIHH